MNPLPRNTDKSTPATRTTFVVNGIPGASVPFHQHSATAITGDTEVLLPDRLKAAAPHIDDCNAAIETGFWSADILTGNTPDTSSFWNGMSIWNGTDQVTGYFVEQIAWETTGSFRMYRRTLNVVTWGAWKRLDPVAVGYRGTAANQTLTNNTFVTLNLSGTADHNIGAGFSIASNVVTVTDAGTYRFDAACYFNTATGNTRHLLYVESWTGSDPGVGSATKIAYTETLGTSVHYSALSCSTVKAMAAGQKVRIVGFQAQGTNNTTLGATYPHQLNIQRVS